MASSIWKKQEMSKDFVIVTAKPYHDIKDFSMEPTGYYVLIRLYSDKKEIGVGICNKSHEIIAEFRGKNAKEILHSIFSYEKEHNVSWFTDKYHIAYIGRQLLKAENVLAADPDSFEQE